MCQATLCIVVAFANTTEDSRDTESPTWNAQATLPTSSIKTLQTPYRRRRRTPPSTPLAKTRPGNYELRLFRNNGYTRLATTRNNFFVTGDARLTCSANVRPGGQITATWSNIPNPHPIDSIRFLNFSNNDHVGHFRVLTDGEASGSRSVRIPVNMELGAYQARLFSFDGFSNLPGIRLAAGEGIGVQADATVHSTGSGVIFPDGELSVSWNKIPNPPPGTGSGCIWPVTTTTPSSSPGDIPVANPAGVLRCPSLLRRHRVTTRCACSVTTESTAWLRATLCSSCTLPV